MKLVKTPIKNGKLITKSLHLYNVAAATIGVESKNEYLATDSLFTPNALPIVIVTPERDTPGINARACDNPIKNVCFNVIFSNSVSDFTFLSTMYKTIPITINAIPIIIGVVNASPTNLSNTNPIAPPGIVASTIYQNIFPSNVFSFFTTLLNPPTINFIQSLKKNKTIASNVPA